MALGAIGEQLGNLERRRSESGSGGRALGFDLYDTVEEGVPNLEGQKLEELIDKYDIRIFDKPSRHVVRYGGRYADSVGMILDSAKKASSNNLNDLRKQINNSLSSYKPGKDVYKGWTRYWSFTEKRT
ncbi:MAG: hypothetical protein HKP13_09940, partial [Gammaproteobacteria bacterium]|nr:hypothetical protein [Gammaproteobacteria bacterium]